MNALDPLKVKTSDGAVWVRAAVTQSGRGLYALEGVASCPRFVMATLDELAVRGVKAQSELADAVAELGALPMPTGTADVAAPMTPQQYSHIRAHLNEAAQRFGGINYVSPTFGLVRDAIAEVDRLRAESSQLHDDVSGACLARWEEEQDNDRLRARVAELKAAAVAALAPHVKRPDSPHCSADGDPWPCHTVYVLAPTTWADVPKPAPGALAEQRHLLDPLDHVLEHLADEKSVTVPVAVAESSDKLRTLLARQSEATP